MTKSMVGGVTFQYFVLYMVGSFDLYSQGHLTSFYTFESYHNYALIRYYYDYVNILPISCSDGPV
jgi:hypothetical protein